MEEGIKAVTRPTPEPREARQERIEAPVYFSLPAAKKR
jgi:hypothetical protein